MGFLSRIFGKGKEDKQEPPKQTFKEWELEKMVEYFEFNKTTGEIWKDIASNHLNGMTLVNGKNPSDITQEDPQAKNNLNLMLACCRAELERADMDGGCAAPYFFERAAILFAKQKDYENEIKICELYMLSAKKSGGPGKASVRLRIPKAKAKKEKAEKKSLSISP